MSRHEAYGDRKRGGVTGADSQRSGVLSSPLVFGAVASVGALVVLSQVQSANDFTANHYLFTYQDGFVRRALIGSMVGGLLGSSAVTRELVTLVGVGILLLFVSLGALLAARAWARGDRVTVVLLAALLVASPQTLVLANDTGKFDSLLLSFTAATALAVLVGRRTGLVVAGLTGLVGVLVHEIHALAGVPLALALLVARHGTTTRDRFVLPLLAGAPAAIAVLIVGLSPSFPGGSLAAAQELLAARAAFTIEDGTAIVQGLSLRENIVWTASVVRGTYRSLLATVLVAVPAAVAAVLLARRRLAEPNEAVPSGSSILDRFGALPAHPRTPLIAAFSPLLLMPLAFDWYRWVAMVVMNLVILGLWTQAAGVGGHDSGRSPLDGRGPGLPAVVAVIASLVLAAFSPSTAVANLLEHVVRGPFGG
jgi:hypothetical protein